MGRPEVLAPDGERLRRFFIVSVSENPDGEHHGVLEAVRSGRKERFQGLTVIDVRERPAPWGVRGKIRGAVEALVPLAGAPSG